MPAKIKESFNINNPKSIYGFTKLSSEFLIKDFQEISVEGGFRNSSIQCDGFQASNNTIEFQLSRGSYATVVIREILKPEDPLSCGF